jgi:hypothetical protein
MVIDFETMDEIGMMSNGWALALASGGTSPYTYLWDTAAGSQTTALVTDLSSGTYYVTITDNRGCITVDSVFIDRITSVEDASETTVRIYPNPASDWIVIEGIRDLHDCHVLNINAEIVPAQFERITTESWKLDIQHLIPGIYLVGVNGRYYKLLITR